MKFYAIVFVNHRSKMDVCKHGLNGLNWNCSHSRGKCSPTHTHTCTPFKLIWFVCVRCIWFNYCVFHINRVPPDHLWGPNVYNRFIHANHMTMYERANATAAAAMPERYRLILLLWCTHCCYCCQTWLLISTSASFDCVHQHSSYSNILIGFSLSSLRVCECKLWNLILPVILTHSMLLLCYCYCWKSWSFPFQTDSVLVKPLISNGKWEHSISKW